MGQRSGTGDRYYHQDWLGSSRFQTDGLQATTSGAAFSAYGRKEASAGEAYPSDFQWGGGWGYQQDADDKLGLTLMGQRYYDAELGRFISEDPSGFADGLNLYAYCGGDPINFADPLGLWKTGSWGGDIGEVFKGYGDALNPMNAVRGVQGLWSIGRNCGIGAAVSAFGSGLWHGLTDWTTTDDPRSFGQSFGTVLLTASPAIKAVPLPKKLQSKLPRWMRPPPARIYSARVLWREQQARLTGDRHHTFPESFDDAIFKGDREVVASDYIVYKQRGTVNGRDGTFEIGVRPMSGGRTEVITHRFFRVDRRR